MNKKMLEILEDVRWWDTCPEDWKKEIFDFLASENEKPALNIPFVSGRCFIQIRFYKSTDLSGKLPLGGRFRCSSLSAVMGLWHSR